MRLLHVTLIVLILLLAAACSPAPEQSEKQAAKPSNLATQAVLSNQAPDIFSKDMLSLSASYSGALPIFISDNDKDDLQLTLSGENADAFVTKGVAIFFRDDLHTNDILSALTTFSFTIEVTDGQATTSKNQVISLGRNLSIETYSALFGQAEFSPTQRTTKVCIPSKRKLREDERFYKDYIQLLVKPYNSEDYQVQKTFSANAIKNTLCLSSLQFGSDYIISLKKGFPFDQSLANEDFSINIRTPHQQASISLARDSFILPHSSQAQLPILVVNVTNFEVVIARMSVEQVKQAIGEGNFDYAGYFGYLESVIAPQHLIGREKVKVDIPKNTPTTINIDLSKVLATNPPGAYSVIIIPDPEEIKLQYWDNLITQKVIYTDIGLVTYRAKEGLYVYSMSYDKATPMEKVNLELIAKNSEILATQITDKNGKAFFADPLIQGQGGMQAAQVRALKGNQFAFVDFNLNQLDLSQQDIDGTEPLKAINAFVSTERGVYRNGEEVFIHVLLRDDKKQAPKPITLRLDICKANGDVIYSQPIQASVNGLFQLRYRIPSNEKTGQWAAKVTQGDETNIIGESTFEVADYIPQTISVDLSTSSNNYDNKTLEFEVQSDYLYGAPASSLGLEASVTFSKERRIFNAYPDYIFGDASNLYSKTIRLDPLKLDEQGKRRVSLKSNLLNNAYLQQPLRATLRVGVQEDSGRINYKTRSVTALNIDSWVGIKKPEENAYFALDKTITLTALTVNKAGALLAKHPLQYLIIEEERDYHWYQSGSEWKYRVDTFDKDTVKYGEITTNSEGIANIEFLTKKWGYYRLEVTDSISKQTSSMAFSIGWRGNDGAFSSPDKIAITTDQETYPASSVMKVNIESPYSGNLHLVIANEAILEDRWIRLGANVQEQSIAIKPQWGDQFYITATVYRPYSEKQGPARAVGIKHVFVEQADAMANLVINAPDKIRPNSTLEVSIDSSLQAGGEVIVMAVDKGILNLTGYTAPDPFTNFFKKQSFAIAIHDLYQHLIQYKKGEVLSTPFGGDANLSADATLRENIFKPTVLVSAPVQVDATGSAKVSLEVPQFNGQLQIMAIAADHQRLGASEHKTVVASPVTVSGLIPRFAHINDKVSLGIKLHNIELETAKIEVRWKTDAGLLIINQAEQIQLAKHEKKSLLLDLEAVKTGMQKIEANITVNGEDFGTYSYNLEVLNLRPNLYKTYDLTLKEKQTIEFTPALSMLTIENLSAKLSSSPALNVNHFVHQLRRYPLGCLEQTSSKAWAFLSANEAISKELQKQLLTQSIEHLGTMQQNDGGFSLWEGGSSTEHWLSMYAIDLMLQVNKAYQQEIPNILLTNALSYVNTYSGKSIDAKVYAQYIMANAQAELLNKGEVRYISKLFIEKQEVPNVQTIALLILTNDLLGYTENVQALYQIMQTLPDASTWSRNGYLSEFKSQILRAFTVAQANHLDKSDSDQLPQLLANIKNTLGNKEWISTHEKAWLLRLSSVLNTDMQLWDSGVVNVNAQAISTEGLQKAITSGSTLQIENTGEQTLYLNISIDGLSQTAIPASSHQIQLDTQYLTVDGKSAVALDNVTRGTEILVKHRIRLSSDADTEISLDAPVPAGFEIENPKLSGLRVAHQDLPKTTPTFEEYRDARYLAAWTLPYGAKDLNKGLIEVHYVIRAVTIGQFVKPAIVVEDMYRPQVRANSAEGLITVSSSVHE